jgi:TldD protein
MRTRTTILSIALMMFLSTNLHASDITDNLESMKKELDRNIKGLVLPDYPGPYFISYLMREAEVKSVSARFGAPVMVREETTSSIGASVRVGSAEMDNTLDRFSGFDMPFRFKPFSNRAPLVKNDSALRRSFWLLTDENYKRAVASFLKVKAQRIYKADDPDFSGCFTAAPKVNHVAKPAPFIKKLDKFSDLVTRLSAQLTSYDFIQDSWVSFDATRFSRYFVNSEGSTMFASDVYFGFSIQAFAIASDGSVIPHSMVVYGRTLEQLPSEKELRARIDTMVSELEALRNAPILQPYSGPTLLEGDTAGVFLHEALGHRLEGHRQYGGDEGGTFSGKVGDQILPEFVSVIDDPSLKEFEGQGINGHYTYDDEAVEAQKVILVDKGKLSGFLLTRRPIQDFKKSNGHSRASGTSAPVARMSTLMMQSEQTFSRKELKKKLIAEAKQQGKPFAIILRNAAGGATNTSSWGFQAFKGVARLVYKVELETGDETLVRGVDLVGTPLASLMKIAAVGNDHTLFNGYCGAESGFVPVSTLTPSILLSELEFQKSPPQREQPQILTPPE